MVFSDLNECPSHSASPGLCGAATGLRWEHEECCGGNMKSAAPVPLRSPGLAEGPPTARLEGGQGETTLSSHHSPPRQGAK